MKTNLKEINSYTRQLDVTIAWDMIEKDYQNEFKRARSRYSIPGFRKGKVPETIVKKNLSLAQGVYNGSKMKKMIFSCFFLLRITQKKFKIK